jgi:hypothetical protein
MLKFVQARMDGDDSSSIYETDISGKNLKIL